jgi:hypothetical protein
MKHRKVLAIVSFIALVGIVFTRPTRNLLVDGVIGVAEVTQHVQHDPCSFFHLRFVPWQRFDPTCPECL